MIKYEFALWVQNKLLNITKNDKSTFLWLQDGV